MQNKFHSHLLLAIGLLFVGCAPKEKEGNQNMELEEASMNFDSENVKPFLKRISAFFDSGFSENQILTIISGMEKMKVENEIEFSFTPTYKGASTPMKVRIFMDDINAPNLYFFTTPELADIIQNELVAFAEDLGI